MTSSAGTAQGRQGEDGDEEHGGKPRDDPLVLDRGDPGEQCHEDKQEEHELVGVLAEGAADDVGVVAGAHELGDVDGGDGEELHESKTDEHAREGERPSGRPDAVYGPEHDNGSHEAVDEHEDGSDVDAPDVREHRDDAEQRNAATGAASPKDVRVAGGCTSRVANTSAKKSGISTKFSAPGRTLSSSVKNRTTISRITEARTSRAAI